MFPIAGHADDESMLNDQGIFNDGMDEEEIDVINDEGREDEDVEQQFHHPGHVLEVFDEEEEDMQYDYMDAEFGSEPLQQFDDGILENRDLYDAHYMNIEPDYLMEKQEDFMFNTLENPQNISRITRESRLALYPEMRMLPPLRRNPRSQPIKNTSGKTQAQKLAKYAPAAAALLKAIKFYPDDAESMTEKSIKTENFESGPGHGTGASLIAHPSASARQAEGSSKAKPVPSFRKLYKAPPPPMDRIPKSVDTMTSCMPLTPLPDRFYQRRVTINAEQAGFISECCQCHVCQFMFRNSALLMTHMEKHRKTGEKEVVKATAGLVCPLSNCNLRSDTIATVVKHMKMAHGLSELPFERVVFKTIAEFKMWRAELERLTMSRFSRVSGKQNIFSKSTYYQCHHSGVIPSSMKTAEELKKARNRPSKKFGKTCTAFFHIRENDDGSVLLRGCTKHTGHGVMVRALPLTEEIRLEIANYLVKGYDENTIIDTMRAQSNPKDRRYFLQAYEIRNVANKIERFKEDYKRKADTGEALPNLAEVISVKGRRERDDDVIPTSKATLSCNPYPVVLEDDAQVYTEEQIYEHDHQHNFYDPEPSSVVVEDGQFNVPEDVQQDESSLLREETKPENIQIVKNPPEETLIQHDQPSTSTNPNVRHSSRLMTKKRRVYSRNGQDVDMGVDGDYQDGDYGGQ